MDRKTTTVDVAIIGGGMVGLSLALLLAKQCADLNVALIEAFDIRHSSPAEMPPSFDARATALAESARAIFDTIGIWPQIGNLSCAIAEIHVSDRSHPGATRMRAAESGVDALGYVVENRLLGNVLMAAAREQDNISLLAPEKAQRLLPRADGMAIELASAGETLHAGLVVIADGANSPMLQKLGVHTTIHDYGQVALITNLALEQPHKGIAYERFTDEGPMALLPLTPYESQQRAALVWTLTPQRADDLLAMKDAQFLDELHRRFGFRAGFIKRCGERHSYPLQLMVAEEQVRRHLVVAGNAAHFLHPVAGQGFNLALRDVAKLAQRIKCAHEKGEPVGELAVLEAYIQAQHMDQSATIGFSHSLPRLFGLGSAPGIALRNAGLVALDLIPPARRGFARFGAGMVHSAATVQG